MQNYDEALLRQRTLDPRAPFPLIHQAVRIALYDEYAARSFYTRVNEAFGDRPPFVAIADSEARHIDALAQLADRVGVARPLDPFPAETTVEASWLANCERAIAAEVNNVALYEHLLAQIADPQARNVFRNLQAASLEHHLPAFQRALEGAMAQARYHAARGIPPQLAYGRHGPVSDFMERAFAQLGRFGGPVGLFGPFLRHLHPSMLAGLIAGGAGVYFVKKRQARRHPEES